MCAGHSSDRVRSERLNGTVLSLPGYPSEQLGRIPMAFLTPQRLPEVPLTVRASQLDLAPTLCHLLNIPVLDGWWGQSVFLLARSNPYVGYKSEIVYLEDERGRQMFPANQDSPFVRLFNTLLVRPGQ